MELRAVRSGVWLLAGGDDQLAVFDAGIFGAIGVVLKLVIAPAAAADVVCPLGTIWQGPVLGIELVAPSENIALRRVLFLRTTSWRKQSGRHKQRDTAG